MNIPNTLKFRQINSKTKLSKERWENLSVVAGVLCVTCVWWWLRLVYNEKEKIGTEDSNLHKQQKQIR